MDQLVEGLEQAGLTCRSTACHHHPGRKRSDGSIPAATSDSALITVLRLIPDAVGHRRLAAPPQHLRRRPGHHPALHARSCAASTTSKNRASASSVTSTPPGYYARTNLAWTLTNVNGMATANRMPARLPGRCGVVRRRSETTGLYRRPASEPGWPAFMESPLSSTDSRPVGEPRTYLGRLALPLVLHHPSSPRRVRASLPKRIFDSERPWPCPEIEGSIG